MNPAGVHIEVELKFPLSDPAPVREKLLAMGFSTAGRVFEYNLLLDTPGGELAAAGRLLRLRRDRSVRLTFKERTQPGEPVDDRYKVRIESELELLDLETMRHVLHRLGYTSERVYEKYREHFTLGNGVCAEIDTLPYLGHFLELEAPPREIEALAEKLGLKAADGLRETYYQLFQDYRARSGLEACDIRFKEAGTARKQPGL